MDKKLGIKILATGRAVPKKKLTNFDFEKIVETSDEWIYTRTGIKSRYLCEEESCNSLAVEAAKKALEKSGIDKDQIGIIITATSSGDYVFPSVSAMIQKELEIDSNVNCFDLSAACTGFIYALTAAKSMLAFAEKKYALVIGSEQMSRLLDYSDRTTCVLFGDGAGAAIIELSDGEFVQEGVTLGNNEALCMDGIRGNVPEFGESNLDGDGLDKGALTENDSLVDTGVAKSGIKMKGQDVYRFAVTAINDIINRLLDKNNMTMDDIDLIVCHQANSRIIDSVKKRFKGHEDKFYLNIDKYGNTSAASIPIALSELDDENKLKGKRCIIAGFGAGLNYSGILAQL
ncbi:3-oxoacyl-[acyl-carrier-protein] synthase-3 [Eubacterium uniforme]|uniref:Beta-ketoacyl-[acyl-carrier-protein] synthase III n=1 Tax=Eubacterium uniforme TaxID=39495 RepID=A0A1T4VLH1_9FIRM|nr:beta-ketoacyl-ACP synthase III [Eubacterium uniforme]SKA65767.1 3-oxoacyl-[acyl-carrier-protein] synthase-3 [Eubacterium uniforme]